MFTKLLHEFWRDEVGATVTLEHVMVGTVGTLGLVGGIASTSNALNDELNDFARAIRSFDQSYAVSGYSSDGFVQTGQPGCLNNGGGVSTGTSFQAYKAGSGFRQTSTSVTSGRARFSSLPNQVVQDADVAGTNGLRMRIEDDQPQLAPQVFQTQQFNEVVQPTPGVLIQPRQGYVVVDADGVIVEEEAVELQESTVTQQRAAQSKQTARGSRENDHPSATKETKSRRKDR